MSKPVRQRIAIQRKKAQQENKHEYQAIVEKVREKRKFPTLLESLEALKEKRSSELPATLDFGQTENDEPKTLVQSLSTQLEFCFHAK